jgi:hypothetical protein
MCPKGVPKGFLLSAILLCAHRLTLCMRTGPDAKAVSADVKVAKALAGETNANKQREVEVARMVKEARTPPVPTPNHSD